MLGKSKKDYRKWWFHGDLPMVQSKQSPYTNPSLGSSENVIDLTSPMKSVRYMILVCRRWVDSMATRNSTLGIFQSSHTHHRRRTSNTISSKSLIMIFSSTTTDRQKKQRPWCHACRFYLKKRLHSTRSRNAKAYATAVSFGRRTPPMPWMPVGVEWCWDQHKQTSKQHPCWRRNMRKCGCPILLFGGGADVLPETSQTKHNHFNMMRKNNPIPQQKKNRSPISLPQAATHFPKKT